MMSKGSSIIRWTPDFYTKLSPIYDKFAPYFLAIGEKAKKRVSEDLQSGSILDIACGTGVLLAMANEKGLECYGMDNSLGMLEETRKKVPKASLKLASFYDISYPENTFDYVVETNAVSGVEINADHVIGEMFRVCKPGGCVLIGDYCKASHETPWTVFTEWIGKKIGDQPHNFTAIIRNLGFEPSVEILGWSGMYQFIRTQKP
jgi:ubiquinone/menaquinone biosynthesis C-methylase UbiE